MTTHLALLRGINVSGHKLIKMEDLRRCLEGVGFLNVRTYIQSGNVFVSSDEHDANKVANQIREAIQQSFGYEVPVLIIGKEDLQACLERNRFLDEEGVDLKKLYVSFISTEVPDQMVTQLNLNFIEPDKIQLDGRRIYLKYHSSPANTKLDNKWIEKSMNVISTTRNWNTVNTLLKMFQQ
ncbi:DUF1697 domain-containing protein [Flavobacterium sedimenticola]|uniref:DUF1697 domain-containing protein n=1 Tax=Flavobacterium sedimenticola TaxID=3043286 RepID=A0ABT6XUJ3_9FLAO|nr:DUF1697 domain-containing protein [Flavobacterium sedimenticola]MDI9258497.1 DUF1697 domain-containing protein [Flavobacterium sedimenticola]